MEGAVEFVDGGFDDGLGTRFFGGDKIKTGMTGPRVADECVFHRMVGVRSWELGAGRLVEVLVFPVNAGFTGGVGEEPVTGEVVDFPLLAFGVEFNVAGTAHVEATDLLEIDHFGVEPRPGAVGGEVQDVGHGHRHRG